MPVLHIEKYGLDSVPHNERTATWFDLFIIWSGVSICLPSFIVGTLLVPACSWNDAVQIIFWGNFLVGVLIVLGGYFGTKTGFPAVVMGRYVFGYPLGQWLPTTALLISTLGWYAVMTVLTGMALAEIAGHILGPIMLPLLIALVGLLNASTAVAGFHRIRLFNRLMVPLLAVFCIYLAYNVYIQVEPLATTSYHPSGNLSFGEGIDLIIGSFLAGAFSASDFSRYACNNIHNWLGTLPGTFFMSFLLGLLGMYSVIVTGEWNPVMVVQNLGMGIPALFFILFANWTTNHNLLYSSGMALLNIFPRLERWKSTFICGILGTGLALTGIVNHLESWLTLLSYIFSPLLGVVLAELFMAGFVMGNEKSAVAVNFSALIAVGMAVVIEIFLPPQYAASLAGLTTAALIYILLKNLLHGLSKSKKPYCRGSR